jgi:H+/Cl- antiporter ClcA
MYTVRMEYLDIIAGPIPSPIVDNSSSIYIFIGLILGGISSIFVYVIAKTRQSKEAEQISPGLSAIISFFLVFLIIIFGTLSR